ncbi:hypothetical protein L9F63_017663, partial [Diploptera punctata]
LYMSRLQSCRTLDIFAYRLFVKIVSVFPNVLSFVKLGTIIFQQWLISYVQYDDQKLPLFSPFWG